MRPASPRGSAVAAASLVLVLVGPAAALAHGSAPAGPADVWRHWALRPEIVAALAFSGWLYLRGLARLWGRAGTGRGISRARAGCFAAGLLALALALLSPLDPLGGVLFSAHMLQHLLLVLVAAPLLVLGVPERALLWALPSRWRAPVGRVSARLERRLGGARGGGVVGLTAVLLAALVLWLWHLPALYDLAVRSDAVHAAEHVTFLASAGLFWTGVLRLRPRAAVGNGLRLLYVFAMALQGSLLGALITLAERPLYASHAGLDPAWGLSPLADQQLAGLLMWIPPTLLYLAVAAYLFVGWLDAAARGAEAAERRRPAHDRPAATQPQPPATATPASSSTAPARTR